MSEASGWGIIPVTISMSGVSGELSKNLVGPSAKAAKKSSGAIAKSMEDGVKKASKAVESASKAQVAARDKATDAAEKTNLAEQKLAEVLEKHDADSAKGIKAANDLEKARRDQARANTAAEKAANDLGNAELELDRATADASSGIAEQARAMEEAEDRSKKFSKALDGAALAIGGMALGGAAALVKMGTDFDDAFRTIRTGTGATGEAFEGLKNSALSVMDTVPAMDGGMSQISTTLADLNTRLGLTDKPLETMTSQMVALSNMGVDADINAVSQAMNGFGIEAKDMPDALDGLFQVSQATGLSITDLANSAVKAGPQLRGFGFSMEDSAALVGQMDKAGLDADATLGKLSKAMAEFADEGRDAPEALQETVTSIGDFIDAGDEASAMNLAADIFGTKGAAQFVDAVKSGTLSVDDFMAATGATTDTILGVSEETRSMGESFQLLKQKGETALQPIASQLVDALIPAIETGAQKLEDFMGWIEDNQGLVKGLAVGVGVAAAAFVTWRGAVAAITLGQKAFATATALSTGGIKAMNAAMKANVIGLIVTAIAGLVAGLVWFFTKTETGQKIWQGFMDVLSTAWTWLKDTFTPVFQWMGDVISSVWDGIKTGASWLWESVLQPIFGFIGSAWEVLSTGIQWYWENVIKRAWDTISTVISWLWNSVLQPIFGFISTAWEALSTAIQWAWNSIIKPAWDAVSAAANWLWNNVLSPVFDFIKSGWERMSRGIENIWNNVIKPAWDAFGSVISWVVDNVVEPAFEAVKTALGKVGDFFDSVVDGIKSVWNGLKSILAKPINFMIGTVYNGGILKAWNTIADFIPGLNPAAPLAEIQENATGGAIRGPGTGTSDDILSWLSNGEHVLTAADVKALGGQGGVYALRDLIKSGEPFTWEGGRLRKTTSDRANNGPLIPAFKDGGDVRPEWESQLERGHEWAAAQNGKPYLTGSQWPAGGDCSGFMSAIASVILGMDPNAGHWATPAFPAGQGSTVSAGGQTWEAGLSQGFSIGMTGGPQSGGQMGHTAGTLSSAGKFGSVNVESGGGHGGVAYGGPAAGADDGQWRSGNYHLAIGADGAFESAGGPSAEEKKGWLRDKVKSIFDDLLSPIDGMFSSMVGDPPPEWFSIPPDAMHSSKDKMIDWLFDRIEDLGNLLGGAYNKAKDLGSAITDGVKDAASGLWNATGGKLFDTGGMLESGGVAVNQSGKPERILSPGQTETFEDLLAILPALLAGTAGVDAQAVLRDTAAAFSETHPDVAGEIAKGLGDGALDFFGLKGTWMTDPSQLGISWGEEKTEVVEDTVSADAMSTATAAPTVDPSSPLYQDLDEIDPDRHVAKTGPAAYVTGIVNSAIDHDLPSSGARIGVATALVESGDPLQMFANNSVPESLNYPHDAVGSDYDSVGLFQQRDNGAWGTVAQRMDPHDSAGMFFDAMLSKYPNWQSMDPGAVAQGVQVSAYPDRYNTKMSRADELVAEAGLYDQGGILPDGALAVNLSGSPEHVFTDTAMEDFVNATAVLEEAAAHIEQAASDLSLARPAEVTGTASVTSTVEVEDTATTTTGGAKSGRQSADNGMVVNLVMENVNTTDPNAASREMMREARRVLAAFV
ncbi:phage tail tape measure protein [Corynebacterium variabile]|uniref:phage tail tape measure protein n=1 Tax=Corynebacterium variabile TaxID=1727 RepID=UPI002896F661|nr:phage tail tape measure protein [Corynebacterium variabile]